jgi:uncharacterized OB-fold protein
MTFTERTQDVRAYRHWLGNVEADYIYTSGVAGDRFFRELRDHGRLLGTRCTKCGTKWVPPKLFCEECFVEVRDWVELPAEGRVAATCVVRIDPQDRRLPAPEVWGLIRFKGFEGGFVHRLLLPAERAKAGLAVRVVLRPQGSRTGAITDIAGFAPQSP